MIRLFKNTIAVRYNKGIKLPYNLNKNMSELDLKNTFKTDKVLSYDMGEGISITVFEKQTSIYPIRIFKKL